MCTSIPSGISAFSLGADDIHVWRLDLGSLGQSAFIQAGWLSDVERQRVDRLGSARGKEQFVLSRNALRWLLGQYLGITPRDVQLVVGDHGKLRLAGSRIDEGIVFNLSHSGEMALVAVARDRSLGVDFEAARGGRNFDALARRILGEGEFDVWTAAEPAQRPALFYRWWVCKEAFGKATGLGLQVGLQHVVVDPVAPKFVALPTVFGHAAEWRLEYVRTQDQTTGCVCYRGHPARICVDDLTAARMT